MRALITTLILLLVSASFVFTTTAVSVRDQEAPLKPAEELCEPSVSATDTPLRSVDLPDRFPTVGLNSVGVKDIREDGQPSENVPVITIHTTPRRYTLLGDDFTDADGSYSIRCEHPSGVEVINLRARALCLDGNALQSSAVIHNAKPIEVVDISVPAVRAYTEDMARKLGKRYPAQVMAQLLKTDSLDEFPSAEDALEFLWKGYPTDQRVPYFQCFWEEAPRAPGVYENDEENIPPICEWSSTKEEPASSPMLIEKVEIAAGERRHCYIIHLFVKNVSLQVIAFFEIVFHGWNDAGERLNLGTAQPGITLTAQKLDFKPHSTQEFTWSIEASDLYGLKQKMPSWFLPTALRGQKPRIDQEVRRSSSHLVRCNQASNAESPVIGKPIQW